MMRSIEEAYLGDGLYASFDGYQIKLRAPHLGRDEQVFLEPTVLENFLRFVKAMKEPNGSL